MNEEEKKAIERLEEQLNFWKKQNIKNSDCEIILNLITKLQKENEEKDKQIVLMTKFINNQNIIMIENEITCIRNIYEIIGFDKKEEDVKKYFETKAKKGE